MRKTVILAVFAAGIVTVSAAQQTGSTASTQPDADLREQVAELRLQVTQLQQQIAALAARLPPSEGESPAADTTSRLDAVENRAQVTATQVAEQDQEKVSSASHFHLQLGGMLLFNLYANRGTVENSDDPNLAVAPSATSTGGDFGGTLRQSELTLAASGAQVWGARVSGDLTAEFAGGFPGTLDGTGEGIARLRIGRGRLDWANTTLGFGLDQPFISPLTPTSYAAVATPALGYCGNLWTWTPQVWVEHRWALGETWSNALQAGVLDPFDGQAPARTFMRQPEAGEASRLPAVALHDALRRKLFGRDASFGAGAWRESQDWGFDRNLTAWAATADWQLALAQRWDLSGEAFRGRGIGGMWGAVGQSIVESGALTAAATQIAPVNAAGGWAQLKFRATPSLQSNLTFGVDHPFVGDLLSFSPAAGSLVAQNETFLANVIEQPRSDLILALEYRHLDTSYVLTHSQIATQINLALGILF